MTLVWDLPGLSLRRHHHMFKLLCSLGPHCSLGEGTVSSAGLCLCLAGDHTSPFSHRWCTELHLKTGKKIKVVFFRSDILCGRLRGRCQSWPRSALPGAPGWVLPRSTGAHVLPAKGRAWLFQTAAFHIDLPHPPACCLAPPPSLWLSGPGDLKKIPEYGQRSLTRGERIKPN